MVFNNRVTVFWMNSVSIPTNPTTVTIPISISYFIAQSATVGSGLAVCGAYSSSSTRVVIYSSPINGSLNPNWRQNIFGIGY